MPDNLTLRRATPADLSAIAAVHRQAYSKKHFTSRLSQEVLARYYGLFLSNGAETMLLTETNYLQDNPKEKIVGFAVFGKNIRDKLSEFKKLYVFDIIR